MLQLEADPFFAGVPVGYGGVVFAAIGFAPSQVPASRGSVEAHVRFERQICLKVGRERAGETVTAHDRTLSGTGMTHSSRRSRWTLMYSSSIPRWRGRGTAEMVGSGTAAASSRDAALWRSRRVPALAWPLSVNQFRSLNV